MSIIPTMPDANGQVHSYPENSGDLLQYIKKLQNENAALRAVKERLDWLGAQVHSSNAISYSWFIAYNRPDIYAAIDAARAKEAKP